MLIFQRLKRVIATPAIYPRFLNFFTLTFRALGTLSRPWSRQLNDVMSEIECTQLHNELFRCRHSTRQSHGLFALAKHLLSISCRRRWIPCWLLTNTAVTSAVTNFRSHELIAKVNKQNNSEMKNFICNQHGERLAELKAIKNAICLHFLPYLLSICRKFEFLMSQGSVATCLRWGG